MDKTECEYEQTAIGEYANWRCSCCGYNHGKMPIRNYCPNCGAKIVRIADLICTKLDLVYRDDIKRKESE